MPSRSVYFNLEHGFIHNWLVAGPQAIPVDLTQFKGDNFRQQIAQKYYEPASGIKQTPVERGPLTAGLFQVGDYSGSWNYLACREDHLVEHSGVYPSPHYLRSWAYTQLNSKTPQEVLLVLTTHGPADVWLNGEHIQRQEHISGQQPGSLSFKVPLKKGVNKVLVRFEAVALRACAHALALQVCELSAAPYPTKADLHVSIPTLINPVKRRNEFERNAAETYLLQDVFEKGEQIRLRWPEALEQPSEAVIRLMKPTGQIYAEANVKGTAGDQVFLGLPEQIPAGPYRVLMMPLASEYYEQHIRMTRELPLWSLGHSQFSVTPDGTYAQRRREALISAAQRTGLFAELAKMALNLWAEVETEPILKTTQSNDPLDLLGILGMLYRFGDHPQFPEQLRLPLETHILSYPYGSEDSDNEAEQILAEAVEILAGQRYPQRKFTFSGQTGQWHRQNGERLAQAWLQQRGATGFSDWDSQGSFAAYLAALAHLIDLSEAKSIWEMAAVVMDKLFATLALNSYQGVFGSTHGRTEALFVKGGLLEPTSGIARLMWGLGSFNHHIAGLVSLACLENYELPALIAEIALAQPEEMWGQERHAVSAVREVNLVTYKTPDGMLSSAQDYYPGQKGCQEHLWQATLGKNATVFVTHPACTSEAEARQPNFWAGNAILPRVAQWKETLIAVYQLPNDDWMGFTHAYFPTYAFDEYVLRQGWAFARQGNGYLALTASQGFHLVNHGPYTLRELRSHGKSNLWLCQMGRAALDGNFSAFQEKILALELKFTDTAVQFTSLRGEALSFGWQGPFLRNGQEQPLSGFAHYENPFAASAYPSQQMDLRSGENILRLNFEKTPDLGL